MRTMVALSKRPVLALHSLLAEQSFGKAIERAIIEQNRRHFRLWRNLEGYRILLNCQKQSFAAWIATTGMYELETSIIFSLLAKNSRIIIDVGAGIGWYSLLGAQVAGPSCKIFAIEPDPANVLLISESAQVNNFLNICIGQACMSDVDGTTYLNLSSDPGYNSIKRVGEKGKMLCDCLTLDSLAEKQNIDLIDLVKVDVEGAEPEVLEGARQNLENQKISNIIAEWNPEEWKGHEDLLELLFRKYEFFKIHPTRFLSKVDLRRILRLIKSDKMSECHGNVLLSRRV